MTWLTIAGRAIGIRGGIAVAFALAFAFMWFRAGLWQDRAIDYAQAVGAEKQAHAVTRASLAKLEVAHLAYIEAGTKRRRAAERALEKQETHSAALERQIAAIRAQRPPARLPEAVAGVCETPAAVLQAGGL